MTYSHNRIRNNIKMTTAEAASKSIRLKDGVGNGGLSKSPSPTTSPETAHSNSIANSTNYYNQTHLSLSTSPPLSSMSSSSSTCSSSSSLGSSGNGGFYSSRSLHLQQQRNRHQRQSPQVLNTSGGAFFHQINNKYGSNGSAQKNRDSPRTSNALHQSPATILGGGITTSVCCENISGGSAVANSGRKQRRSPLNFNTCGKSSPPQLLIPTALTHFAGSKCFDAPAPTALPKPPQHWTLSTSEEKVTSSAGPGLQNVVRFSPVNAHFYSGVVKSSKRNLLDDFDTHNLKLLLNVQS